MERKTEERNEEIGSWTNNSTNKKEREANTHKKNKKITKHKMYLKMLN